MAVSVIGLGMVYNFMGITAIHPLDVDIVLRFDVIIVQNDQFTDPDTGLVLEDQGQWSEPVIFHFVMEVFPA